MYWSALCAGIERAKMNNGTYTISEAARAVNVSTRTIMRWEESGKIGPFDRDYKGWRVIKRGELDKMKEMVNTLKKPKEQ